LELARRDQLPFRVLRVGRSYRVATVELLRLLGLEPTKGDLEKDEQDRALTACKDAVSRSGPRLGNLI
jgi:hypothetical protein